jgi:hypothetical protein
MKTLFPFSHTYGCNKVGGEKIHYSETVVDESRQRTKYTMLTSSVQEEDLTMIEDIYFVFWNRFSMIVFGYDTPKPAYCNNYTTAQSSSRMVSLCERDSLTTDGFNMGDDYLNPTFGRVRYMIVLKDFLSTSS